MGDRVYRAGDCSTAQGLWKRGQSMNDDDRRALERAATKFFWKGLGMARQEGAGRAPGVVSARPAARDRPSVKRNAGTGDHPCARLD